MNVHRPVILLGPQRHRPSLADAVASLRLGEGARLATVTAGWEEREPEDLELDEHLGGNVANLRVFQRADDVYRCDPELHRGMRERHDLLRQLQALYRLQLARALDSARELMSHPGDERLLGPERDTAIEAVRTLDRRHLERVTEIQQEFESRWRLPEREHVARHRHELARILEDTAAVCVAGGHVAILLNRMRLFDLLSLAGDRPLLGWSAGAMALSERIVLFHDSPPQGAGNAEVLGPGLRACAGVVPLPHARTRLRLGDGARVALLARRFGPDLCAALDEGCRVQWDGERWSGAPPTRWLSPDGSVVDMAGAV